MPYTYVTGFQLGAGQAGILTDLRAALVDTVGVIHTTLRDISTGFIEIAGGGYGWTNNSIPNGYTGYVVFYTGVLGPTAVDFTGVIYKMHLGVSPREVENTDVKVSTLAVPGSAMTLAPGAITEDTIILPAEEVGPPSGALQLLMWIAGWFGWRKVVKDADKIQQFMDDDITPKTTSTYTSDAGVDTINKAS